MNSETLTINSLSLPPFQISVPDKSSITVKQALSNVLSTPAQNIKLIENCIEVSDSETITSESINIIVGTFSIVWVNGLAFIQSTPIHPKLPEAPQHQEPLPPQDIDDEFNENNQVHAFPLLLKLAFLVYILSQNASRTRIAVLYVCALLIFLIQTRWIRLWEWKQQRADGGGQQQPVGAGVFSLVWSFVASLLPN